ncbi:TPA: JAB domain-containing protein [Escherichia coli]
MEKPLDDFIRGAFGCMKKEYVCKDSELATEGATDLWEGSLIDQLITEVIQSSHSRAAALAVDSAAAKLMQNAENISEYLNNQNQLIAGETLFTGTINRTEVHPREVIKRALYHNAAAVVLAHNHPSGEVTPSKADRLITERLVQALGLVDIRVPDHLIVGGNQVFSFAEHGLL